MATRRTLRRSLLIAAVPALVAGGALAYRLDPRGIRVVVTNKSGGPVADVRVDDRWFRARVSKLGPGESRQVWSALDRGMNLEVAFRDGRGRTYRTRLRELYPRGMPVSPTSIKVIHVMLYEDYASIVFEPGRPPPFWEKSLRFLPW